MNNADKERIEKEAFEYASKLVDKRDIPGTPQFICYVAGATAEREKADAEIKELREDRKTAYDLIARSSEIIESKDAEIAYWKGSCK